MDARKDTYFSIACNSKPGEIARINARLMEAGVSLAGIWGFNRVNNTGEVYVIPEDVSAFKSVAKERNWKITEGICFRLEGEDSTGALVATLREIADKGINIKVFDAITLSGNFGCIIWPEDEFTEELEQILGLRSFLA